MTPPSEVAAPPPPAGLPSLPEVHRSVAVPNAGGFLRKLFAFMGPGYLVAVGYMDPGNWATSLAGGSAFGYTLLAVALTSSLMAILLQALCVRIGVSTGRDLAQLCRERFPKVVAYPLWLFAEIAICATDLAELIGTAIALELLFGIPLLYGVFLTALDAFLILWLQNKGVRWLEALIFGFIVLIVGCFGIQIVLSDPDWAAVLNGYIPAVSIVTNQTQLYIAMGILGATVMPHNLYLHTAVVQSRSWNLDDPGKREAIKFATIDSSLALTLALLINSAILITAAATFHASGNTEVAEIGEAYQLLTPLLRDPLRAVRLAAIWELAQQPPEARQNLTPAFWQQVLGEYEQVQLQLLERGEGNMNLASLYQISGRSAAVNTSAMRTNPRSVGCTPSTVPSKSSPSR